MLTCIVRNKFFGEHFLVNIATRIVLMTFALGLFAASYAQAQISLLATGTLDQSRAGSFADPWTETPWAETCRIKTTALRRRFSTTRFPAISYVRIMRRLRGAETRPNKNRASARASSAKKKRHQGLKKDCSHGLQGDGVLPVPLQWSAAGQHRRNSSNPLQATRTMYAGLQK